jgi:hypothetical protein
MKSIMDGAGGTIKSDLYCYQERWSSSGGYKNIGAATKAQWLEVKHEKKQKRKVRPRQE